MSLSLVRYSTIRHCRCRLIAVSKLSSLALTNRQFSTSSCKNGDYIKKCVYGFRRAAWAVSGKLQILHANPALGSDMNKILLYTWLLFTVTIMMYTTHYLKKQRRETLIDLIYEKQFGDETGRQFESVKWLMVSNEMQQRAKRREQKDKPIRKPTRRDMVVKDKDDLVELNERKAKQKF